MQGLYIHIPFCKSRCIYCDFYSTVQGEAARKAYADALIGEMDERAPYLNIYAQDDHKPALDTVYLGGGTPSVLAADELLALFDAIQQRFDIKPGAEITMEVNPDDVDERFAEMLLRLPVNRVSMGVQTFSNEQLRFLRRRHTASQVDQAIACLNAAGISNVSIDLIYGLPNQTLEQWRADLEKAFSLPVAHLSAYALIYEEGTALYAMRERGEVKEADDELSLQMFQALMEYAESEGFNHYEISNFARPNMEARHNTGYWRGMRYLGLGPGAHSYDGTSRQWNSPNLCAYISAKGKTVTSGLFEKEVLTPVMRKEEIILTQLRTAAGIDLPAFSEEYGSAAKEQLMARAQPFILAGQLSLEPMAPQTFVKTSSAIVEPNPQRLCLTREGVFVSDDIMATLFD